MKLTLAVIVVISVASWAYADIDSWKDTQLGQQWEAQKIDVDRVYVYNDSNDQRNNYEPATELQRGLNKVQDDVNAYLEQRRIEDAIRASNPEKRW